MLGLTGPVEVGWFPAIRENRAWAEKKEKKQRKDG